jgi:succinate dehydrogenase/fumarate reductase cytochrome b subunit
MEKILAASGLYNKALPSGLGGKGATTESGGSIVGSLISSIVGVIFIFGFCLALLYLLLGGIQWITSGGDKAGLEGARNKITNAIIGLVILGASWAIFTLVGSFFGITLPNIKIPTIGQ